jgi:hypothetical protein
MLGPELYGKGPSGAIPKPGKDAIVSGGVVYYLSGAGLIACKDVGVIEAFTCPWPPSPIFYKLL